MIWLLEAEKRSWLSYGRNRGALKGADCGKSMITLEKILLWLCFKASSGLKESKNDQGANTLEAIAVIHMAGDGILDLGDSGGDGERD